jgi:hypothetical protein
MIVGLKLDPVGVAAQLGHSNPATTLRTYSHPFDRARHADETRRRRGPHRLGNGLTSPEVGAPAGRVRFALAAALGADEWVLRRADRSPSLRLGRLLGW